MMRALLEHIQREHGSMEALLDSLGVGPERRTAMRAACLVDQVYDIHEEVLELDRRES